MLTFLLQPQALILLVILLNLSLGLRGLGREDRDFFTMQPFSDPLLDCRVTVDTGDGNSEHPFPFDPGYRFVPKTAFTARAYQETLPAYAKSLSLLVREKELGESAVITCSAVHGVPGGTLRFDGNT